MICENWDPFKKNEREALIKKMVLKRLADEIRAISCQTFGFFFIPKVVIPRNCMLQ